MSPTPYSPIDNRGLLCYNVCMTKRIATLIATARTMETIATSDDSEYWYFSDDHRMFAKLDLSSCETSSVNYDFDVYSDVDSDALVFMNIIAEHEDSGGDETFVDILLDDDTLRDLLNVAINLPD